MDALTLHEGATVTTRDGTLGRLRHIVVGPETREVTELVVADGDQEWLVPASAVTSAPDDRTILAGARAEYQSDGSFDSDLYELVDEDQAREETERRVARRRAAAGRARG